MSWPPRESGPALGPRRLIDASVSSDYLRQDLVIL